MVNRFAINLRAGYDMPLDPMNNYEMMPSVFCDVSVGPKPGVEYHEDIVRSSTCLQSRNPVWNENLALNMSDITVHGVPSD